MSDGSRTQRGCITCRIRKKKCDEQRPICQCCRSRQLACYGYDEAAPAWYTSKANWKEVRDSDEARNLQTLAETRYKIRRRVAVTERVSSNFGASKWDFEDDDYLRQQLQLQHPRSAARVGRASPSSNAVLCGGANIWQLRPDTIWWDSKVRSLAPDPDVSNEKTRLLMLFLDVIHPISHSFYKLNSNKDRRWMLNRLVSSEALYSSALSISACFDCSLTQPPSINNIGICPQVRSLQSKAVRELQIEIDKFVSMQTTPLDDFILTAVQLLDVVTNLEMLEIFSMLQGCWEMHHRASRKILNHVELCVLSSPRMDTESKSPSLIESVLSRWPTDDERRRSLEFCLTNFIWVDVLAISTFGLQSYDPCAFSYLGLLQSNIIKPQEIMGCQGWIMAKIVEIAHLEQRIVTHQGTVKELLQRDQQIAEALQSGAARLERQRGHSRSDTIHIDIEEDSRLISILWAYGAQILRQTITSGLFLDLSAPPQALDQTYINATLTQLESLPPRLLMRASWPYTIAGCMSTSESQHARFQRVFARTMQAAQPPGISWKGLIVMQECWRLRRVEGGGRRIGWREAMERLGARVLLT